MNQKRTMGILPKFFLLLVTAAILVLAGQDSAAEIPLQSEDLLLNAYHRNMAALEKNSFGIPLLLESFEQDDRVQVDVYGIFDYPFNSIVKVLKVPSNWCDIVSLHPNVKACTFQEQSAAWLLTFYLGRKTYQPPKDSRKVMYQYRKAEERPGYIDIILSAGEGPLGTKDHRMRFEALPLDEGKTFVHVSYAYSDSIALRLAEKLYFSTLGWGKVGFTVTGKDRKGNPVYIGGPRAALERNAVRYYFAIRTYMDALRHPEESRFGMRLGEWYDLTDRYRLQLYEMDKKDYLAAKDKEHQNQVTLQQSIGTEHH